MIAAVCLPSSSARVNARVQPQVGRAVDVSALTGRELAAVFAEAQEREPLLLDAARAECPPDSYTIVERFLQTFEAARGEPFTIGGAR